MNNIDLKELNLKLTKSFEILGFKSEQLETILQKVLIVCATAAITKVAAEDKNLLNKLKTVDIKNTSSLRVLEDENLLNQSQKDVFVKEFKVTLDEYLKELLTTLDPEQKGRVEAIWK